MKLSNLPEIICEPGRAVAESGSTIVKVMQKKIIFIIMMVLMDRCLMLAPNFVLPSKMVTDGRVQSKLTVLVFLDLHAMVWII